MTQEETGNGSNRLAENISAGGDVVGGDKIVAGGDVVQGDKITHVTVNRGAIQIGTFSIPTLPVILGALVVTAGLIFVGLTLRETPGPTRMKGGFNVAVAQFGRQEATGQIVFSEEGQRLSRTVFEVLRQQTSEFSDIELRSLVQIWHDDLPNSEMGTELGPVADEGAAQALAERIGADMVIYGAIDQRNELMPKFYITTQARGEIDATVTGHQALGSRPIRVDPATSLGTGTDLARRARALFYLTIGLTYDAIGRSEEALNVYRDAEIQLASWNEKGEGKETLYFFLGQAALYLSQQQDGIAQAPALRQEARQAFENGVNSNPTYPRPHVGLGSVYFLQAQETQPLSALLGEVDVLNRALDEYRVALDLAQQASDRQAQILSTYSLGTAYYLQGRAHRSADQIDAARGAFRQAGDAISSILGALKETSQPRLLGQAYQAVGNADKQLAELSAEQGDPGEAKALYEQARQAYERCIELGNESQDAVLHELVIQGLCIPQRDAVTSILSAP
jgi:tetratricopeptide (TPR) repeat protein